MDAVDVIANTINLISLDNEVHRQLRNSGDIRDAELCNKKGDVNHMEECKNIDSSSAEAEIETISHAETEILANSKELDEKNPNQDDNPKSAKAQEKSKRAFSVNEKPSNSKPVVADLSKKSGDGNQAVTTSSISNVLTSQPKQPLAHANNEISLPEASKEQRKNLKPLKKNGSDEVEEHPQSTLSSKPRRLGTASSYSFSFKCDERAEKRKEFFTKLEEKIHVKEVERSNMQAKTKETQEAEIKLLRKSLTFKATPMPSFYQEPVPPKVELKKMPPTRAKSPKLGRQKRSEKAADVEAIGNRICQPTHLSLDDRVSQNGLVKDSCLHSKKPQRKSLPRLPSEKVTLANPSTSPPAQQSQKLDLEGSQPNPPTINELTDREKNSSDEEPVSEIIQPIDEEENPTQESVSEPIVPIDKEENPSEEPVIELIEPLDKEEKHTE